MAKQRFPLDIDLMQNELQNSLFHKLSIPPSNPKIGQFYFDAEDLIPYYWNGLLWKDFGGSTTSVQSVSSSDNHIVVDNTDPLNPVLSFQLIDNENLLTDDELAIVQTTSGTNTGDQDLTPYLLKDTTLQTADTPESTSLFSFWKIGVGRVKIAWSSLNSSIKHSLLSDLSWLSSGHTGTANTVAGFDGSGIAKEYALTDSLQKKNLIFQNIKAQPNGLDLAIKPIQDGSIVCSTVANMVYIYKVGIYGSIDLLASIAIGNVNKVVYNTKVDSFFVLGSAVSATCGLYKISATTYTLTATYNVPANYTSVLNSLATSYDYLYFGNYMGWGTNAMCVQFNVSTGNYVVWGGVGDMYVCSITTFVQDNNAYIAFTSSNSSTLHKLFIYEESTLTLASTITLTRSGVYRYFSLSYNNRKLYAYNVYFPPTSETIDVINCNVINNSSPVVSYNLAISSLAFVDNNLAILYNTTPLVIRDENFKILASIDSQPLSACQAVKHDEVNNTIITLDSAYIKTYKYE